METHDISWISLAFGSLLLLIPAMILYYYKTGLVKAMVFAFIRMAVQLALVGFYLGFIFKYNSMFINMAWVAIMIVAASTTIVKRSELKQKYFFVPVLIGVIAGVFSNVLIYAFAVIGFKSFLSARYIIPISGMIIGNCLSNAIIGMRSFYQALQKDEEQYKYYLVSGATKNEALFSFVSMALKNAFAPTIASTATIGLIWLPGLMTGQILGGSSPSTAIKYQIMIMISIFSASVISTYLSVIISKKFVFDDYDLFRKNVIKEA